MLHYRIGDATDPKTSGPALICHICNDKGLWGSGFVVSVSKKDDTPEHMYKHWHRREGKDLTLGEVQICPYTNGNYVANMICQHDVASINNVPPIRYEALEQALKSVFYHAKENGLVVCMPRIGAVRSGGDWSKIEKIIKEAMGDGEAYVYTLPQEKNKWPQQYESDASDE
jgi:O-acetyl-ADP-ribose deacetylase (regulator of RNase III)